MSNRPIYATISIPISNEFNGAKDRYFQRGRHKSRLDLSHIRVSTYFSEKSCIYCLSMFGV